MYDAVEIEKRGYPTITICHDKFESAAHMHMEIMGNTDIPLLIEPIPKGGSINFDTVDIARQNIDLVIRSLTAQ